MELLAGEPFKVPKANGDNRPDVSLTYCLPQHPGVYRCHDRRPVTEFSDVMFMNERLVHIARILLDHLHGSKAYHETLPPVCAELNCSCSGATTTFQVHDSPYPIVFVADQYPYT